MPELALALYVVYLGLAFGARTATQLRRTGSTGFHGVGGRPGSAEWLAGAGFVVALALGFAALVLALVGGIAGTLYAQVAMGNSWRIGVDHAERTALVTSGPFAIVRNPIFSAMLPTALGLTLLVPSWLAIAGFAGLLVALELQVRVVEEPHLLDVHRRAYADYSARVGRFVPGVGRLRLRVTDGSGR